MKISVSTHYTNPEKRMDPWKESLSSYKDLADEVIVVGENWPEEFSWDYIGKVFQEGLDEASGDWVFTMDIDKLFHENDLENIKEFLYKNMNAPAVAFPKRKFFTTDRYEIKNKDIIAINKKDYPNIKLNGGGDLCLPTLNGKLLEAKDVPNINIPIWNYDTTFRTQKIIADDRARFARAWFSYFNEWSDRGGPTPEEAYEAWYDMVKYRYPKHVFRTKNSDHPKYIQEKIKNINSEQFGFSAFGLSEISKSKLKDYYEALKIKLLA